MKTRVSEKGQITIPKRLREELGIRSGMQMEFVAEQGRLIGRKVEHEDPIVRVTGVADTPVDVDAYLAEVRGEVE